MSVTPKATLQSISPYVPGTSSVQGFKGKLYKLSSNENALGASPKALDALKNVGNLALYPDGQALKLREALAAKHGLRAENIICGAGSDEVLNMVAQAYLGEGAEGVYSAHGFLVYRLAILGAGGMPVVVPEDNLTFSCEGALKALTPQTKLIFLANPNNPTGTYLPKTTLLSFYESLPKNVLLVLDEAYAEFVTAEDYESLLKLAPQVPNLLVTRTFSKLFGLAALRIGWGVASSGVIEALNKVRGPFNLSSLSISAGAAAVEDEAFISASIHHNTEWREKLTQQVKSLGYDVVPSQGNFILVDFKTPQEAQNIDAHLQQQGVIVRRVDNYGLPQYLRLSIGDAEANAALVDGLKCVVS